MDSIDDKHFVVILGARPNFVKAAAFFRGAESFPNMRFTVIHTGQHFDDNMSRIFFDEMNIPRPDIQLSAEGEFHTERIGRMFNGLQRSLEDIDCDGVVVFGDVNSTLSGALAALKAKTKLVHVEAGLRSHDRRMPEEINRVIIDHIADLLFTTEPEAEKNLLREGIDKKKIFPVGNLMLESYEHFESYVDESNIVDDLKVDPKKYVVVTVHRQENTDNDHLLKIIMNLLQEVNQERPVVLPLHPGTKSKLQSFGLAGVLQKMHVIDPLGYFDFMKLVRESGGVITDSGGIQEETTHLGIPCCTLRDNTERPITVTHGSNKLFPLEEASAADILSHLTRADFKSKSIDMWDKGVSKRILEKLNEN